MNKTLKSAANETKPEDIRLTPVAVAAALGIGVATLIRWEKAGRICPGTRLSPRKVFWLKSEVDAFVAGSRRGGVSS